MSNALDELASYLQSQGLGTVGTDIFKTQFQPTPDTATCIYPSGGLPSEHTMNPLPGQALMEQPTFQIRTRALNPDVAYNNALAIFYKLDGLSKTQMGSTFWHKIVARHPPLTIGPDENNRISVVVNYEAFKEKSS